MLPAVYIIGCGGTIAGRAASQSELIGYQAGEVSIDDLIQSVPQMTDYASIRGEQFCNIDSSSMTEELLLQLARHVQDVADRDDVDGIVITHGTDTMDETAYFLHLTVHTHKPVVLVGAMRPATAISADGPMNLLEAVRLAATPRAGEYGVLQVMNSTICSARFVEKTDTTHVHTFTDGQLGALGFMQDGVPVFYQKPLRRHTYDSRWTCPSEDNLPPVWILYCHIGMTGAIIETAMKRGIQGIVLAGMGHGNLPKYLLPVIKEAQLKGLVFVRATRASGGIVSPVPLWPHMIGADNLSPQKARLLLQLALQETSDVEQIQRWFGEY